MRQSKQLLVGSVAAVAMLALLCPIARAQDFQHDNRLCVGDYALCAASTCTPTGGQILVNTATGKASFPAATCTCPIFNGEDIVDVNGGNMTGTCQPPSTGSIWSGYWPKAEMPQQLSDWQTANSPGLLCGEDQMQGNQFANCFSFLCVRSGKINGVEVATCTCPIGESQEGTPVPADTAFYTQAGQCSTAFCSQHPVSLPLGLDDVKQGGQCFQFPGGDQMILKSLRNKL
jgi:hypothetical protein